MSDDINNNYKAAYDNYFVNAQITLVSLIDQSSLGYLVDFINLLNDIDFE